MFFNLTRNSYSVLDSASRQVDSILKDKISSTEHQFKIDLPVSGLTPGWYFAEIELTSSQTFTGALFIIQSENHEEELHIPLKGGKTTKRLIWIRNTPDRLSLDLGEPVVDLKFARFKFDKTIMPIALSRMKWKLHHRHISTYFSITKFWEAYNRTFIPDIYNANYEFWINEVESRKLTTVKKIKYCPSLTIIVYSQLGDISSINNTINSISSQNYDNADVFILTANIDEEILKFSSQSNLNIKLINNPGLPIYKLLNISLKKITGDLCIFVRAGDTLNKNALLNIAKYYALNEKVSLIYGDDDEIDECGKRINPRFKPEWNPIYFFCYDYISDFVCIKSSLIKDFEYKTHVEDDTEIYCLLLWCLRQKSVNNEIIRIPIVLSHSPYHVKREYEDDNLISCKKTLLKNFFKSNNREFATDICNHVNKLSPVLKDNNRLVSILIPTRDNYSVIKRCISSILEKTSYRNYEIIVLNNQSTQHETLSYFKKINHIDNVRVVDYNDVFNFSAINNYGVSISNGDLICLLNDDTAIITPDWLSEMVSYAVLPEIGCVGAKLFYSNGKIQHGGVILGLGHVAGHAHRYFPGDSCGYMNRLICTQYVSAVTGACLLVRREIYEEVDGLDDKNLTIAYNDVDFCIKVKMAGYHNIWTPHARLYHYESLSRGADNTSKKKLRYNKEVRYMHKKWKNILKNDPYYHPYLTNKREDFTLRF